MSCGFWLRLNGVWVPLRGVKAGVQPRVDRASSSITTVGGVRHTQASRRAARTWTLDFGHAGPEAVAALTVAAQGDGGDVMLWDESIARENLLDPLLARGRESYPVVDCDGIPLLSLTRAASVPTLVRDIPLKANAQIRSSDGLTAPLIATSSTTESLVKAAVPFTPAGLTLSSSTLILNRSSNSGSGTVTARLASNGWSQPSGATTTNYWTSVPSGATMGSAPSAALTQIPLSDISAFLGTDLSLRLTQASGSSTFVPRNMAERFPVLRLAYTRLAEPVVIPQHLRADRYYLSMWTDAVPGTTIGTIAAGGSSVPINIPAGDATGLRRVTIDLGAITLGADRDYVITLTDSTAYVLAGLMLSNLPASTYLPGRKTPSHARVSDPTLVLDILLAGQQGRGPRGVTIEEVGT